MKYTLLLSLSLVLVFGNVARADSFDSDTATIKKSSAKVAKVTLDKKTYLVPITFGDDASWDSVKDHYELSDAAAAAVKSGKASITVGSDGGLSTSKKK
jgi:hypothetical protein